MKLHVSLFFSLSYLLMKMKYGVLSVGLLKVKYCFEFVCSAIFTKLLVNFVSHSFVRLIRLLLDTSSNLRANRSNCYEFINRPHVNIFLNYNTLICIGIIK